MINTIVLLFQVIRTLSHFHRNNNAFYIGNEKM